MNYSRIKDKQKTPCHQWNNHSKLAQPVNRFVQNKMQGFNAKIKWNAMTRLDSNIKSKSSNDTYLNIIQMLFLL